VEAGEGAAADALQREGKDARVEEIDAFVAALPDDEVGRASHALDRLLAVGGAGRRLLLCVDNLQQVLGRLDEREQWELRKLLSGGSGLVVVAASPATPADTTDYGAPFYDFFQISRLPPLTLDETLHMLGTLAEAAGQPELRARLDAHPGRIHALHTLTGGNPRTVALLLDVLLSTPDADVRGLLEALVDKATPLYKARFEELAEQAQVVLGALALEWNPAIASRLAEATRRDVNTVSTQLARLARDGLVLKVEIAGETRTGFLVAERFFNLWYLMRASRRLRGRVVGFARCLEAIYEPTQLQKLAETFLHRSDEREMMGAISAVVTDLPTKMALWSRLPPMEVGEYVAEPGAVAYANAGEARRRAFAERAAMVGGFDHEAHGLSREDAELAAVLATQAERFRDTNLPLAVALEVAGARDRSRLTRYAPEVQAGARVLLEQIWPDMPGADAPEPTPARRYRRPRSGRP
jgi:DNA-binding transcriptional regulator GbsR (MarR family)